MEDARARLGRFLAKERSLRDNPEAFHDKAIDTSTSSSIHVRRSGQSEVPKNNNILSSPDTFEETKKRVARVKASPLKTAVTIRKSSGEFASPKRNIGTGRQGDSSSEDTPGKSRKRFVLKSPNVTEKKTGGTKPRISRSLSPVMINRGGSQSLLSSSKKQKRNSSYESTEQEEHEEDDEQSTLSLPFPQLAQVDRKPVSSSSSETRLHKSKATRWNQSEPASKPDPSVDAKLCCGIIEEILSWETSLDEVQSQDDLVRKLRTAESSLKRMGLDRLLWFKRSTRDPTFICVGDERHEIPIQVVDNILSTSHGHSNLLCITAEDPRFDQIAKCFQLNDSFEAKVIQDGSRYVLIAVSKVEQNGVGRFGDAFRSMVSSTTKLLVTQVWESIQRTVKRLQTVEEHGILVSERNELSQQRSSREALLAMSLWSASSEFDLCGLVSVAAKTAATFGPSWIIFLHKSSSNEDTVAVGKYFSGSSKSFLDYEEYSPSSTIVKTLLHEQPESPARVVNLSDVVFVRWLEKDSDDDTSMVIKSSFATSLNCNQHLHCILITKLVPSVKKSIQLSHMTDLTLIAQTALGKAIDRVRSSRVLRWSEAPEILMKNNILTFHGSLSQRSETETIMENIVNMIDCIESSNFCQALSIRRAVVLFDQILSAEFGFAKNETSNTSLDAAFFQRSTPGFKKIKVGSGAYSHNKWLEDLAGGNVVLFNPSNAKLKDFAMVGGDASQFELLKFVSTLDVEAQSVMLVPINITSPGSQQGMAIIVLIDNFDEMNNLGWLQISHPSDRFSRNFSVFDSQFFERFQNLGIASSLSNLVVRFRQSQNMAILLSEMNLQLQHLENETLLLSDVVSKLMSKRLLHKMFCNWKVCAHEKKTSAQLKNKEFMLDFVMNIVNFRQQMQNPSTRNITFAEHRDLLLDSFLLHFESWLRKVFPTDSVRIVPTANHLSIAVHDVQDNLSIVNAIIDSSGAVRKQLSTSNSGRLPLANQDTSKPIAKIIISRPSANGNFSYEDVKWLDDLCTTTSMIYTSLAKGLQQDGSDGDARSLAIPMLESIIVPLMGELISSNLSGGSGFDHSVARLCIWIKKLCGADLVMANLRADIFSNSDHAAKEGMLAWSTDSADSNIEVANWLGKALQEIQNVAFVESSKGLDQGSVKFEDRSMNVFTVKIRDVQQSNGSIGDVKIVMPSGSTLTEDHCQVTQLAIYLLATVMNVKKYQTSVTSDQQSSHLEYRKLLQTFAASNEEIKSLRLQNQYLSFETSYWIQSIRFGIMIRKSKNIRNIASCVWDVVPDLLRCESALFAVCSNYLDLVDESVVDDTFVILAPKSGTVEEVERVSSRQLLLLPRFFDHTKDAVTSQSMIPLTIPGTKKVFGALIIFQNSHDDSNSGSESGKERILATQANEDVFGNFLNDLIVGTINGFFLLTNKNKMQQQIRLYENEIAEKDQNLENIPSLTSGLKESEERSKSMERTIEGLQEKLMTSDLETQNALKALKELESSSLTALEETRAKFQSSLAKLQEELSMCKQELGDEKDLTKSIIALIHNFAYDPRCNREEVMSWLKEVANSHQSNVYSISRMEELGKRQMLPNELQNIPGIWSAIGEAIRTGNSVSFSSQADVPLSASRSSKLKFVTSSQRSFEVNDTLELMEILCVPNRALCGSSETPKSSINSYSCYVFTRPKSERWHSGFEEVDKILLEVAVNISSRLLMKTPSEVKVEEFFQLEQAFVTTQSESERLFKSLNMVKDAYIATEVQSTRDLTELIKNTVHLILHDHTKPLIDIECHVVYEDQINTKKLKYLSAKAIEMIKEAKVHNTVVQDTAMIVVPFGGHQKVVGGLIVVEKKLRCSYQLGNSSLGVVTLEALNISNIDQKVLTIISTFSSFVMDKIDCIREAFESIEEAGSAISIIQEAKTLTEDKLAIEINSRTEMEQALKMSGELLNLASSQRNAVGQLLDLLRKQVIELTFSEDAYVIIPNTADSILSEILLEEGDAEMLIRSLPSESQSREFFTLLPDNPGPSPVSFEAGDLELQAVNNFRTVFLPSTDQPWETSSGSASWRSWVARRIAASKRLGTMMRHKSENGLESGYFVMAVPFYLRTTNTDTLSFATSSKVNNKDDSVEKSLQGKIGVVVIVRSTSNFTETDQLCVSWLTKAFSYCLGMRGGEMNTKHNMLQLKQLQKELSRLQHIDDKYHEVQNDLALMVKAFKHGLSWNGSLASMIDNADENIVHSLNQFILADPKSRDESDNMEKFEQRLFIHAVQQAFMGENLRFEVCTDRTWSDFYVAHLSGNNLAEDSQQNIRVPYPQDEFVREGHIASYVKYTFKFGFVSLKERNQTILTREEVWSTSNSKIPQAICRLEVLGRPIQYYLISRDNSGNVNDSSLSDEDVHGRPGCSVGFNLLNLDLKLLIVEKICTLNCLWKDQAVQYAREVARLHDELEASRDQYMKMLGEKENDILLTESRLTQVVEAEREKGSMMVQRSQRSQRMLESIQNECSVITNFIFSLSTPAGALDSYADLVSRIALAAQYDFGTGSYVCTTNDNTGSSNMSIVAVEWLRNERNLVLPLIELCNKVDFSGVPGMPKLPNLSFRITVFINSDDQRDLSSASAKLKQELRDFHDRCLELGEKLSFAMEIMVLPIRGDGSIYSDSDPPSDTGNLHIAAGSILLESTLPLSSSRSSLNNVSCPSCFIFLQPQQEHELVSKATIKCLFRGLYQIAINSYLKYIHDKNIGQIVTHRRLHGISKLQMVQIKMQLEEYRRQANFQVFQIQLLAKRTLECNELNTKCSTFKHRSTLLDQLTADWTELVKGLNSSSRAIIGGIPSIWARACHSLLSVLSSRCTVTGCGLIIMQDHAKSEDANRLIELIVRNVTTPVILKQRRRQRHEKDLDDGFAERISMMNDEINDCVEYANANLERRSVQELGHRLTLQLLEIFGAPHIPTASHSVQRLYKVLSTEEDKDSITYLIPVRTHFSVIAALRVTIENLRFSSSHAQPRQLDDVFISKTDVISAVENNLVNFADMMAPTLISAVEFHQSHERFNHVTGQLQVKDLKLARLSSQWSTVNTVFQQFKDAIQRANQALEEVFFPANDTVLVETSLDGMLEDCCGILTSIFSNAFNVEVEISIDKSSLCGLTSDAENLDITRRSMQTRGFIGIGDRGKDEDDDEFANRLTSSRPRHGMGDAEESSNRDGNKRQFEIIMQRESICDVLGRRIGELRVSTKKDIAVHVHDAVKENSNEDLGTSVFKSVTTYIAFVMIQILDKYHLQKSTSDQRTKYIALEQEYCSEIEKRKGIEDEKVGISKSLGIQGKWTKISNNCLEYVTSPTYHNFRFPRGIQQLVKGYSLTEVLTSESTNSLLSFLHSLLENTLSLLGKAQYGINLAVLDGKVDDFGVRKLIWIHGGVGNNETLTSNERFPPSVHNAPGLLSWKYLPENTRSIAVNMTNLCISSKQPTAIDVRQGFVGRSGSLYGSQAVGGHAGSNTVHVSVLPLFYSYASKEHEEVIGALQIISFLEDDFENNEGFDQSSESNFHVGKDGLNEDIVQDLTSLLSRLLSFEIVQTVHSHDCLSLEANLVTVKMKEQEEEHLHTYYEKLSKQWQMLTYLLRDLHQSFEKKVHKQKKTSGSLETKERENDKEKIAIDGDQDFDDLIDIFNFESTRKYLHELGMIIRLKFGLSLDNADPSDVSGTVASASTLTGSNVVAKTVIPLFSTQLDAVIASTVSEDLVNAHVEIILLDTYTAAPDIPMATKTELMSHSYDFVDIIAKTIRSLITQYHRVHGLAVESNQTVDSVRQELQKYKLKSSKYHQEVVDQRTLLALKHEESKQMNHELASFQAKILELVHAPALCMSVSILQSGIQDVIRHTLSISKETVDISYFCNQSVKILQHAFDQYLAAWQKSSSTISAKHHKDWKHLFSSHFSLLLRKDFNDRWQSLHGRKPPGQESSQEEKFYKEADLMKLIMFDGHSVGSSSAAGSELVLIKQSRLLRDIASRDRLKGSSEERESSRRESSAPYGSSSLLEKMFFQNEKLLLQDDMMEIHQTDLIGVENPVFLKGSKSNGKLNQKYLVYCIGMNLSDESLDDKRESYSCDAVLRFICVLPNVHAKNKLQRDVTIVDPMLPSMPANKDVPWSKESLEKSLQLVETTLLSSMVSSCHLIHEFAFVMENALKTFSTARRIASNIDRTKLEEKDREQEELLETSKLHLSRYKKLHKIVLRECSTLLDPPLIGVGGGVVRPVHPASLAPLAASQDSCMKVLNLLRTLLRTEGQALLLKDVTTVPHTYQIIYSGDALSWPGIEQNTFGVVSSHLHSHTGQYDNRTTLRVSLVETVASNRKTLICPNAPADERYASQIDGICSLGTPLIIVPIRGRGGAVVGVMMGAKGKESMGFTGEDAAAAEMVASMGALSLYWCQGLGSVHHTLHKALQKMDKLEKVVQKKNSHGGNM